MSRYCLPLSIYAFPLADIMKESTISYSQISLSYETVSEQRVARITLLRPDTRNCINDTMAEEIRDACRLLGEDEKCRLVTLDGAGGVFSVGRAHLDSGGGAIADQLKRLKVADSVAELTVPVLAILNGDAIGHGLELALAGDLRIAADSARFALREPPNPAMPWDGGTQRLPRLVGPAWALDMALTGRRVAASEALQIGLVNRVAPAAELQRAARQLEEQVLASAPIAARYAKEAIGKGMDLTLEQGLGLEADLSIILQSTTDRAEGIASFRERRQPKFTGA